MKPIILQEHRRYDKDDRENKLSIIANHSVKLVGTPDVYMGEPTCLGVNDELEASYYVGASWIIKNELPLIVLPKFQNLDFTEMLITALSVSSENERDYFSMCYGIEFEEPLIETEEKIDQLTPILLIHFISILEKVVQKGLKRDYKAIEENLKGKIKGHVVLSEQLKRNIISKRQDRNYCRFQTYTSDIPENRLLKKALRFSQLMLNNMMQYSRHTSKIQNRINKLNNAFEEVSDNIELSQVKRVTSNKLFRHYPEAIRVAKDILRRFDYSISNISSDIHKTPPFWVDMSRLFELYVYSKLSEAYPGKILFQVQGTENVVDYIHIDEQLVIDAKYKPIYESGYKREDIREISCYSRDIKILKNFGEEYVHSHLETNCLIIFPGDKIIKHDKLLWDQSFDIPEFRGFRKFDIIVPQIAKK